YQTVRYPLSGLVGNPKDLATTYVHNQNYPDPAENANILTSNVKAWLDGTVKIKNDYGDNTPISDTFSVYSRYKISLDAPNYTVFSNKASMAQWIQERNGPPHYGVALEEGHNAIHLALGGFYQKDEANANEISGANGDMGENETTAFDPIFFLHHAFVDYVFWIWQRRHRATARGSLTVDPKYDGTTSAGSPGFPKGMCLDMNSALEPFRKASGEYYTSEDVTDIEEIEGSLAYTYAPGSFDCFVDAGPAYQPASPLVAVMHIGQINRADHEGSFVICTYAELPDGREVQIGRESVLSRWHVRACANCLKNLEEHSFIAFDEALLEAMGLGPGGGGEDGHVGDPGARLKEMLRVEIHTRLESETGVGFAPGTRPSIEMLGGSFGQG
ncbi:tyrosinase family protein, partial [Candidatus Bathyarchaeota archaeon]|nr:tyrosinase family protein [Candidatus Bathyarchaeota archaeon]